MANNETPDLSNEEFTVLNKLYAAARVKIANYSIQVLELETLLELEREKVKHLATPSSEDSK